MADVILKLIIDGKEFDAKIKDADKQIAGLKKDVQKHSVDMTASLKSVAGAMGLAFGAATVVNFMKSSIESYAEQEKALKKLEVALGKVNNNLVEYANQLQRNSTFADEQIVEGMARIAMFTKEENQIKQLITATLDFAAAKDMDLVSATDAVVRTLNGEADSLARVKLNLNGAAGSQERLNSLVSEMTKLFGGQAGAQLDTTSGKILNMKNRLDDVSESIGERLIPVVTNLLSKIDSMLVLGEKISKNDFVMTLLKLGASPWFTGSGSKLDQQLERIRRMYEMQGLQVGEGNIADFLSQQNQQKNILFNVPPQSGAGPTKEIKEIVSNKKDLKEVTQALAEINILSGGGKKEVEESVRRLGLASSLDSGAGGAGASIKEMTDFQKQSMGVMQDTTDAMWRNLIIGGRQAVDQWDAIWLAFRNSALQRLGEIVQDAVWNFLFDSIFSLISGGSSFISGNAASAVISSAAPSSAVINPKINIKLDAKLIGEDIYLSNKRVTQRRSDNSL